MTIGIYSIENIYNGKRYIGQTIDFNKRKVKHLCLLRRGVHPNKHLQNSFIKYGEDNFIFNIVIVCDKSSLTYYEQKYVDALNPEYNIRKKCVDSNKGYIFSEEVRKNMSRGHIGKSLSENHKSNISNSCKGKVVSEKTKIKISEIRKGTQRSQETKTKVSEFQKKLWASDEYRKKMSNAHKKIKTETLSQEGSV